MLWKNRRQSDNVVDVRDGSERSGSGAGRVIAGGGCGTFLIVILALIFGFDPQQLLRQTPQQPAPAQTNTRPNAQKMDDEAKQFMGVVLADTEDFWGGVFQRAGRRYSPPKLFLYTDRVNTACGLGQAASGPFYCPGDRNVYLDFVFFRDMKTRFQAPGDFAQAYVVAHEVGHHVQQLLGTSEKVEAAQRQAWNQAQANDLSIRLELQADFYAGMWARYAANKGFLERGDMEEALNAATAVGDDRLQARTQGYVVPDSFTHGTSAQRLRWFKKGFDTGDIRQGNTFNTREL
jgi:predicted metalloprotease